MGNQHPLAFLLRAATLGLAAAALVLVLRPSWFFERPTVELRQIQPGSQPLSANSGPFSYADAVQRAAPAVVNIYTTKVITRRYTDSILKHFFGDQFASPPRRHLETSLGSGVLVSAQGYILTSNHVIEGSDEILVSLADGRNVPATIVGTDPETDLAVLHTEADGLSSIVIGASAPPRVGDIVLAIGNPFGVGQTVTMGIVSATGRDQLGISTFEDFIQTDAAINPGNSGGALINARGELVGINTAIYSESGGSHGIGFAVPARLATQVMKQIIEHGHAVRGWLGIEVQNLTPSLATSFGLKDAKGVIVAGVLSGSAAERAGLQPGDIITHIDELPTENARDLLNQIAQTKPGTLIEIRTQRGKRLLRLQAKVAQRPVQHR